VKHQFLDLAGNGQIDLVLLDRPAGFFERTTDESWESFRTFESLPNIDFNDPNLRFIDVTGDGHADILISEDQAFVWHESLAENGFDVAHRVAKVLDEEKGPAVVFAERQQTVFLADMSGDGLNDIVRVRNGEICYWPNLGYGRFGANITMEDSPWFDLPDQFDSRRIRLGDLDGSGPADLLYIRHDRVSIWRNQAGNSWRAEETVRIPGFHTLASVTVADLTGRGTACIVWSSQAPGDTRRSLRYIDPVGERKPHLLRGMANNLGAETHIHYASSTKFYLADRLAGRPWITRLPFPVHVCEKVETFDRISKNYFVTRYAFHHGYFDGVEREFRGFGMVEQWDTESFATLSAGDVFPAGDNIDPGSHLPSVLTRTWFHTGVFLDREHISNYYAGIGPEHPGEYYREPGIGDAQAKSLLLDDTVLPGGLTLDEQREACRALKGSILRQEVYALDGSPCADHPYSVSERNYAVRLLQPRDANRFAVFLTHARETLDYHYERNPADPRIAHSLTLETDEFANVLKSVTIGYGRRRPDLTLPPREQDEQTRTLVTYAENTFTNPVLDAATAYRTPLAAEARTYELTGYAPTGAAGRFRMSDFVRPSAFGLVHICDGEILYEQQPGQDRQRRPIQQVRTYYRPDDFGAAAGGPLALLPLGELESLAVTGENYQLAFTPGLLAQVYARNGENLLPDPAGVLAADIPGGQVADRGGYVDLDRNDHWWIPSGRTFHSPGADDDGASEVAHARRHFFLAQRYRDPFGAVTTVVFDVHDLLAIETCDALGNRVTAGERDTHGNLVAQGNDYRVLQPQCTMDPNRNRTAVAFDRLGLVVGSAVMGKPEENLGDSLVGFDPDLNEAATLDHLADPFANAHGILAGATSRLVYDLFAYARTKADAQPQPPVVYTMARETHAADLADGEQTKIQHGFSYSDGFGREIQKKIQAERARLPDGTRSDRPRWVGSGWTIFNNKGKEVRKYEPFFSDTHRFEFARIVGVSPVLFYDPVGRVVATLHPNNTYEKVVFDPWRQATWDRNDTVLGDPRTDPDIRGFTASYFSAHTPADGWQTWYEQRRGGALGAQEKIAAEKTAAHADTPTVGWFDGLGRAFRFVADNAVDRHGVAQKYATRTYRDIEGNEREVVDALDRVVMRYDTDMLGNRIHQASMEAGERWTLNHVVGKPIRTWDSRGHRFRSNYDLLRRPTDSFLGEGADAELLVGRIAYGEIRPDAAANNLRSKAVELFDQAGVVTTDDYDFKGNLLRSQRQLAQAYKTTLDWSAAVPLEADAHESRIRYDALNRQTELTSPDNSIIRHRYNEANLLERVDANLHGAVRDGEPVWTPFVADIDYDAKGQRASIDYGNGARTTYRYDPLTFRLVHLLTRRDAAVFPGDCLNPIRPNLPGCAAQNLHYTYDPAGNITHIRDDAQQTIYFRNTRVEPSADYSHDAIYRLIEAAGREHLGQAGAPVPSSHDDAPRVGISLAASDGNAMGRYRERYVYDAVGNFQKLIHRGSDPAHPGWTRTYTHDEASLLEPSERSNRVTSTTAGGATETYSTGGDGYDAHGSMLRMAHLQAMQWDFRDQLRMTQRQAANADDEDGLWRQGERTWYVYDSAGQRVRKVTERQAGTGQTPASARLSERRYIGSYEIYREYGAHGSAIDLERQSLHVVDDKRRIVLVETRTIGHDAASARLTRYQFANHLGSANLELDDQARVISYEEYFSYGSTSYQAVDSATETPKRYRYTGKERDKENGFNYHGARYYAPWLGRWMSCDPIGIRDGVNVYAYVKNGPLTKTDETGKKGHDPEKHKIRKGDTFWGLETKYHYKHGTLQELNKGVDVYNLNVGSDINLPSGKGKPDSIKKDIKTKQAQPTKETKGTPETAQDIAWKKIEERMEHYKSLTNRYKGFSVTGTLELFKEEHVFLDSPYGDYLSTKLTIDWQMPQQKTYNVNVKGDLAGKTKLELSVNLGRLRGSVDEEGTVSTNVRLGDSYRIGIKASVEGKFTLTESFRDQVTGVGTTIETTFRPGLGTLATVGLVVLAVVQPELSPAIAEMIAAMWEEAAIAPIIGSSAPLIPVLIKP
jgi:RHS repeat-associated protein